MHKDIKRLLCMEACHPGNSVSVNHGDFKALGTASTAKNAWTKYAASIAKDKIEFLYNPINKFPFYQDVNYVYGPNGGFNYLPIQVLGRMQIRLFFKDDTSVLFNKTAADTEYRFLLTKCTLMLKELRVSPAISRQMASFKGTHIYRGLTKIGICENIEAGNFVKRLTIPNIDHPEGAFIFCVDKKVISGTAKFQDMSLDGPFLPHNIKGVDIHFNGQHFFTKNPTFGTLDSFQLQRENYAKMLDRGIFGMKMDPDQRLGLSQRVDRLYRVQSPLENSDRTLGPEFHHQQNW